MSSTRSTIASPITHTIEAGVAEIVMERPPVNALRARDWYELADALRAVGADPEVRAVVLRAEGRGFNAGVDIKEIQAAAGHDELLAVNDACFAAFAAVYECAVPVICAVHGYCLGGGVGLAGNADLLVASDDARFGLPEVDRGALGAATHLARLVPQQLMRKMVYTAQPVPAAELHRHGSVLELVPRDRLRETAVELARQIAGKSGRAIRAAKLSLNGIDPIDVHRSYRYEQGFTYRLTLAGVGEEARNAFVSRK